MDHTDFFKWILKLFNLHAHVHIHQLITVISTCQKYERLKTKPEESTRLGDTGLLGELEHLKIKMRLIDEMFPSVMGVYDFLVWHYWLFNNQNQRVNGFCFQQKPVSQCRWDKLNLLFCGDFGQKITKLTNPIPGEMEHC